MPKLFDASGNLINRQVIPMHARHVRGMCDGQYFATHPTIFEDIQLELLCHHCLSAQLLGAIQTTPHADRLEFRCAHTHGYIRTDRRADFSALLHTLGWTLRCPACGGQATGENDPHAPTLDVTCACTIRRLANPVAKAGTA
jgi:hypothetical protein